ncbi:MAG TPA: MBOAT family O-acyltransferase [Candidatus Acidoferrum sp.]|nr:MBOAT family O-acyltransferase [Candidatus Acidoferrum sp.]
MALIHHLIGFLRPANATHSSPFVHVMHLSAALVIYIVACRLVMRQLKGGWREILFAGFNLAGVYGFLFYGRQSHYNAMFVIYLVLICFQYAMLRGFSEKKGWLPWLAFFTPIAALIVVRYSPGAGLPRVPGLGWTAGGLGLVGISYLAFRTSRLVLEVRNGSVKRPRFCEYLNFCFFLPTMPVGPINSYANYRRGFEERPWSSPMGRAALRILVGLVKYQFLGGLCSQLGYSALLLDDHPHPWMDLPVAMLFYYLFLYCNFSGFCDMAIGAAALIGIPVPENFENPFAARNVKDFWNRWHITLSQYMRDLVFAPLSKYLVRAAGPANADHAIALAIVVVFLLIGIWHGVGWNFAAYGAVHALGVVANHYYTIFLKKRLGRDRFRVYNENRWIRAAAVAVTFCYCGASLCFFANTFPGMKQIISVLR